MVNLVQFQTYNIMGGRKRKFKELRSGIYILGEGITELYYFDHLKTLYNYKCYIAPRFFCNTCITDFDKRIEQLLEGDITVICVFDTDESRRNQKENQKLKKLKTKYSKKRNVIFCDSFPCIEYWFLLHYIDTCPSFANSNEVEKRLKKHNPDYEKTGGFLKNISWVNDMSNESGNLENARLRAIRYGDGQESYSNIYKALDILDSGAN